MIFYKYCICLSACFQLKRPACCASPRVFGGKTICFSERHCHREVRDKSVGISDPELCLQINSRFINEEPNVLEGLFSNSLFVSIVGGEFLLQVCSLQYQDCYHLNPENLYLPAMLSYLSELYMWAPESQSQYSVPADF